jgi:hypothetical protein
MLGALLALGGFIGAWLDDSAVPTLILTGGLALAAWGMANAETAVEAADDDGQ